MRKPLKYLSLMLIGLAMSGAIAACTGTASTNNGNSETAKLTLVSYAVTQSAYSQIIPKFVEQWKNQTGQEVIFDQSYGGSGSQTRAVIDGLEADVVALALALDTKKIEQAGLIQPGWEKEFPNDSIVHKSVAALVKRDDSVKITSWADLANKDIKVVTANPKTSGGARWNFLALWGAVTQAGGNEQQAEQYVATVLKNAPVLPKDAREASDVFYKQGQGNVLINYENEVILAQQKGEKSTYVIPTDYNISIDNPVAIVDTNVDKHGTREIAEAFVEFLFTPEAQREFAKVGFRPVDPTVTQEFASQYPAVKKLFTVKDLGGWDKIQGKFFDDGAAFDKIMSKNGKS
ncbi:sulfate ABC transporter, periplasmic sulfate-binding protein [Gloeothece citriformis PCC 7424]|uniref:Sulfate-binding protein n=1 Tax=Gloeothece citriformis (strain PCC 7424) TaxID=65393 RepID=B7KFD2_GLOC7|nr:sulfate ABC transporter substrate-binding protein [Gloeothece citriformis]ACK71848.1 sulfate ABC transporter, periplasmic sulfate-binding protein [Gloeothece citriformis PCC 7424]